MSDAATSMSQRLRQSRRMAGVQTPIIPVVGELIRVHPGTISLGQGVVHYGPPEQAIERAQACVADPSIHSYKPVQGIPHLLDAIEAKLSRDNGITVGDERRVIVTAGANMGFMNAVLAVADPGDQIVIQHPYYFNHEMAIAIAGCEAVAIATDDDYQLDVPAIEAAITDRTRAVVTISPNNPSGAVYAPAALRQVNQLCRSRGIYHISDEAYEYFTYDGREHFSPGSIEGAGGHTISLYSLSKAYGFASWRIGYMVIPAQLEMAVKKIADTILICPPVVSQHAAVGAMQVGGPGGDYLQPRLAALTDVRALVLDELSHVSALRAPPRSDGAFYVLLRLDTNLDDMTLVEQLVRDHGVAAIPGRTFGIENECCLRVAYGALEKDTVAEGIGRLVHGLNAIVTSNLP